MATNEPRPIIVKKIKKTSQGHHGGAWKIAYADFVTAMMAFFLLMWLLGSTSRGDLNGIAEYFKTPLKVAMAGGSGSGDSSSLIAGGGTDLTRKSGQVSRADMKSAQREAEKLEAARLGALKIRLERLIENNPSIRRFSKQLLLDITAEGLRIQIIDEKNRPMFALSSVELQPYTREILRQIGKVLNEVPNRISLSGHTDAAAYASGERGYSNWELSSERANASRKELVAGGMAEVKVLRVIGLSSSVLFNRADPYDPSNRRISIIVMNKRAEEAAESDGGHLNVTGSADLSDGRLRDVSDGR